MYKHYVSGLILCALLAASGLAPRAAAAQSVQTTFTNARLGYTWRYPATWQRVQSSGVDLLVLAPDSLARMYSMGVAAGLSTAGVRQFVDSIIEGLGVRARTIAHSTRVVHGVTFQVDQATFLVKGVTEQATALAASLHGRTYLFASIVGLGEPSAHLQAPHAQQERAQIQSSFASIVIR